MRLINCETLQFEEFIGKNIPPYAILSHTWEIYEISYKEYNELGDPRLKAGPQADKIVKTCDIASQAGFKYVCESDPGGTIDRAFCFFTNRPLQIASIQRRLTLLRDRYMLYR